MQGLRNFLREHLHFIVVVTLLTLVMTFPTIVYVIRTDVFWLPAGQSHDVYLRFWDIWYGKLIATGQADRFYTDLIYYPGGVSLAYHPLFYLHSIVVSALHLLMPISNAYSLTYLLIIYSSALAAYLYLRWLFKDKWLALFGAVVFGFCPQVTGYPNWPTIAWIAPTPLIIYCVHRGIKEKRANLIFLAGLFTGLTSEVIMYYFVCVVITLGVFVSALAASRWRDRIFWRHVALLATAVALSCAWRMIPVLQDLAALDGAIAYADDQEISSDLISFFVNPRNPILGPLADSILQTPENANKSLDSYIGFLPLLLLGIGLTKTDTRRKMLPWLGLGLGFLILSMGSTLHVNGTEFENIKLPKHFLDQLRPPVFAAFHRTSFFMSGVWLPLAVLSCYGLDTLKNRYPDTARPRYVLALIAIVAIEYFIPVENESIVPIVGESITEERLAYLDWLDHENDEEIRLINLPLGRQNAKVYVFYQSLSGYPQTEGAISRPPDSVYNYIRANHLLKAWYKQNPINCNTTDRESYLSGLTQLLEYGFSHIVYHYGFYDWEKINDSFRYAEPAYGDDFVSIYRLNDLRDSCSR